MQPLISPVDHESRHNSYRVDDENESLSETTPLLSARFPTSDTGNLLFHWSTINKAIVATLLVILMTGIFIGVYLLIEQNKEENVLPPVEVALQLVSNSQWDDGHKTHLLSLAPFRADHVVTVQTDSHQCWNTKDCIQLLQKIQFSYATGVLPYNFAISPTGETFEALGWRRNSPLFPEYSTKSALVLAFIGNFTESEPTSLQLREAEKLLDESVSQQHLTPSFDIIGKNTNYHPTYLFQCLRKLKQWNQILSDTE